MAPSLPLSVRVVVGLVATGWDAVRHLPSELPALSVSIAGHAVRLSMRVQQEITELAARGDELLAAMTSRPSEHPTWARFDEEDGDASLTREAESASGGDAAGPTVQRSPFEEVDLDVDVAWVAVGDEAFNDDVETLIDLADELDGEVSVVVLVEESDDDGQDDDGQDDDGQDDDSARAMAGDLAEASSSTGHRDAEDAQEFPVPHLHVVPDAPRPADGDEPSAVPDEGVAVAPDASTAASDEHSAGNGAAGPGALPGYDRMTLAQVRGRLRGLSADDIAGLLTYEQAGAGRAPFLTLLSNRMATLEHEAP